MRKHSFGTYREAALAVLWLVAVCEQNPTDSPTYDMTTSLDLAPEPSSDMANSGLLLPDCVAGQLITVGSDGMVRCISLSAAFAPPSCAANSVLSAVGGQLSCVPKGTGTTDVSVATAINQAVTRTQQLQNAIAQRSNVSRRFIGLTAASFPGLISGGGVLGLPAAAVQCSSVYGSGSGMCTVYEMYASVAAGVLRPSDTLAKSWVYMASWQNFGTGGAVEPTAGLSDSCGAYTSSGTTNGWYGTAIKWENATSGNRALKIYTGPTGANEGAPCNFNLPIACCR